MHNIDLKLHAHSRERGAYQPWEQSFPEYKSHPHKLYLSGRKMSKSHHAICYAAGRPVVWGYDCATHPATCAANCHDT